MEEKNENQTDTSAYEVRKEHWKLGLMPYFWKLNSNEPKLTENLKNIKGEDLELLGELMEEITDGVVAEIGASAEKSEDNEE